MNGNMAGGAGPRNTALTGTAQLALLALMKIAAVIGAFVALCVAGLSVMAFDAPGSEDHILPYVIVAGAWMPAVISLAILMRTNRLLAEGRKSLAYALLLLPPSYAGSLIIWIRFG